jgi:hypothetical protein
MENINKVNEENIVNNQDDQQHKNEEQQEKINAMEKDCINTEHQRK